MAGVKGDGNSLVRSALLDNVIGKALGSAADYIDIHAVDTGSDDASQSGGAELQVHIKALFDLVLISGDGF